MKSILTFSFAMVMVPCYDPPNTHFAKRCDDLKSAIEPVRLSINS